MVQITVKTINLNKSKLLQMERIPGVPKMQVNVLGWINLNDRRYVLVNFTNNYYLAEYITKLEKELKPTQTSDGKGGWTYPELHHITCHTYNNGHYGFGAFNDDSKNIEFYEHMLEYKRKTELAGQIYY